MSLSNCITHYINAWKNCSIFSGRINREQFWCFQLINILLTVILLNITEIKLGPKNILINCSKFDSLNYFTLLFLISSTLPQISNITKRLHDVGKSGWLTIFYYIPILNIWILMLLLKRGDEETNEYGSI